jgi:enamine deaminase RidA (YjgF/YER057c/UK114 family)
MTERIKARLAELGIDLPARPSPVANYVPYVRTGNLIFVSGQLPLVAEGGERFAGIVGETVSTKDARDAARAAAINVVAVVSAALEGDLDRVSRVVKVTGFINSVPGFGEHPEILNGASDLFVDIFGEIGRHARAAVGAGSLPRNMAVEVEAVFEVT